ncbi:transglutaminase family protein [Hydrogenophaga sp. 5NK40-0174]|uniref:transglutaminase family protein n=1 Tax=Hydrogenophaga sp. 5NK40-0174 TaxID=3127649 RepID=UPI0031066C28
MELRVLHHTRYDYQGTVNMAQHLVHLSPLDRPSQTVSSHDLSFEPAPAFRVDRIDSFGNHQTTITVQAPHETLDVVADSLVTTRIVPPPSDFEQVTAMTWESVQERFRYRLGAPYDPAVEFAFPSPMVPRAEALADFAREVFTPGRPILEAAVALMTHIHTHFAYEPASTDITTPVLQALEQRKGVCQDFAHIMLGCLRSLGLPARYVSGYLLTHPKPGQPRLVGADASHAWVSLHLPSLEPDDATGNAPHWVDLDPTNDRWGYASPGEDYVTLAVGRDFSDVSPMRGVIQGGDQHTLDVGVTVAPPSEWPAADATPPEPA